MAKKGDLVVVHYQGLSSDGMEFDSSEGREPLRFTLGAGSMIPGFENAIYDMKVGDVKKVIVPCSEAYGPVQKELILKVPRENMPKDFEVQIGDKLQMQADDGGLVIVKVVDADEKTVTIDANHELAGKDLTFIIHLVEIKHC